MVNQSGFIVRKSGLQSDSYYIDYSGSYKVGDIAKITGIKPAGVIKTYSDNGAIYDDMQEVYYFRSVESARKAIGELFGNVRAELKCKTVNLTEAEVEYIRRALINEVSNTIHLKSKIKDEIFRKLNE